MRRKNLGNRIVKKAITWAMIVMMSFSGAMSGFASMTVYAEGTEDITTSDTTDNEINNYGGEHLFSDKEFVDSSQDEYHNNEANEKTVEEYSQSVQTMTAAAESAVAAADDAKEQVNDLKDAVNTALNQKDNVNDIVGTEEKKGTAETAGKDAQNAASEAQIIVNNLPENTFENVEKYNDQIKKDEAAVETIGVVTSEFDQTIVGIGDSENDSTTKVSLEVYVQNQLYDVQAAADDAEKKLKEALDINTDILTDEVRDKVDEVQVAAQAAIDAYTKAENAKEAAKREYNLYAMAYGLPLYGKTEITYSSEDAIKALEAADLRYQVGEPERLEEEIKAITEASLENQEKQIKEAEDALTSAKKVVEAAQSAVNSANTVMSEITEDDTTADNAVQTIVNCPTGSISRAQEALEETNKNIEAKNTEISKLETAYESATTDLEDKRIIMEDAKREYNNNKLSWEAYRNLFYAKKAYEEASELVKNKSAELQQAQEQLRALENEKVQNESQLNTAIAAQNAYMDVAAEAATEDARKAFKTNIENELKKYSDKINQMDYDIALNEFVNGCFNTLNLGKKYNIREEMNSKYVEEGWAQLMNKLALTQWMIGTEEAEQLMNSISDEYRHEIEQCYEKMATAEAKWAAIDTEAARQEALAEMGKLTPVITSITNANAKIIEADSNITAAKKDYQEAVDDLKDLQTIVKNLDIVSDSFLMQKMAAAKAAVETAEKKLLEAESVKASAQKYADWANELITVHYTGVYAQIYKDENGDKKFAEENLKKYDTTNADMKSRPTSDFITLAQKESVEVPYAIYKDYVEAMYKEYDSKVINVGKGTSTGSNLDVIYWKIIDGKLTGDYYTSLDDLLTGTYFVGYAFKQEKTDGYHLDGIMFEYEKPEEPVEPTPGPTTTPGGGTTPDVTPDDGGDTTVIIPDAPVALAAAPVAADNGAAVLGARRTDGDAAEAAVLGARRGTEQAVLGKRRKPQTGDSAALNAWMAAMTMAAGAAGISGTKLAKGKKKEEKED